MRLKNLSKMLAAALFIGSSLIGAGAAQAASAADSAPYTQQEITNDLEKSGAAVYPIGQPNTTYAKYFTGRSFVAPLSPNEKVSVSNVTFEPGCINYWHIHHGSCQVLAGVSGKGYYQIWGQPVQEILPGTSVVIPENTKHWHGAQHDSWFQHLAIMASGSTTEWLEPVNEADYAALK